MQRPKENNEYIAFYGTLTHSNQEIHQFLDNYLSYVGPCLIEGMLEDLGRLKGLKPGPGNVNADIYKITNREILVILDDYESEDNENPNASGFKRKKVRLAAPDLLAWVYFYEG